MSPLSQLPTRMTIVVCIGVLLSALVPSSGKLDIIVSVLTLVLIIMLLREDMDQKIRGWMKLALGTYALGVTADLLDEIPELNDHWLIDSSDDIFMHIGVFLICFCFVKMLDIHRTLISELHRQVEVSQTLEVSLSQLALEDDLTGLNNRRALFRRFDEMAINTKRGILAYIDLDNFKQVNDTFSHQCGDKLLTTIAEYLTKTVPTGSHIYRIGGDEFVVLLPSDNPDICQAWIDELYDVSSPTRKAYKIDISIGLSPYYPGNLSDPDSILAKADKAMYQEKLNKRPVYA
ncbi:GGDEF domain-containing protein [Photobacterium lutimaris]|uniref:diguanylate cyclase n=1 Tax=Photobacterium lutimaris TaxID=388278 RepID=A0A2T3J4B1_9GAMM|nr:GGDEF domain-containing protein [Photobacterium lutimaris]PSU36114.1 GGDEF domain-containing protein [Photobacterium lutimaris]TDR79220.1 diguanylate cyclase (GGDEF)-like protein [Photobacterium lutimaris]